MGRIHIVSPNVIENRSKGVGSLNYRKRISKFCATRQITWSSENRNRKCFRATRDKITSAALPEKVRNFQVKSGKWQNTRPKLENVGKIYIEMNFFALRSLIFLTTSFRNAFSIIKIFTALQIKVLKCPKFDK